MSFKKTIERLDSLHHLILKRRTGNVLRLANTLGVNRSSVYRYIKIIKSSGIEIYFDEYVNSYVYPDSILVKFNCGFTSEPKKHNNNK